MQKESIYLSKSIFFKSPDIKNIMVCYFWGGEDVIKMWSKMFEIRGCIAIELDSELTQELTEFNCHNSKGFIRLESTIPRNSF